MSRCWTFAGLAAAVLIAAAQTPAHSAPPTDEELAKVHQALPDQAYAQPAAKRKLLVFSATRGFRHSSIEVGATAITLLGQKTGAFEATHTEDLAAFEPASLDKYDALLMLNTTGEIFRAALPENAAADEKQKVAERAGKLQDALLKFVHGGKGLAGIHSATDTCYEWPAFGDMIGGYFDGHPWHEQVVIKLDDAKHPLLVMFDGKPLTIVDEIYQLRDPYSRSRNRVLMSLDVSQVDMTKQGIHREDHDFAVSWVRAEEKGRVFYCSLGHREEIYWNPTVLKHYLAGLQFVLGDLKADTSPVMVKQPTPSPSPWLPMFHLEKQAGHDAPAAGFTALFNGRDLSGWRGLVAPEGGPPARAKMTPEQLAEAQREADASMKAHWSVRDGVLCFDGKGDSLCTAKDYGDFEMYVDWKIEAGGDSGIYLRGSPQVQIWDTAQWPEGSGGLYNNQHHPAKPMLRADKPVGEWNTFHIRMIGDRVSVWLNDVQVVDDVTLENYWERGKPIFPAGAIELQSHKTPLQFRNVYVREIPASEAEKPAPEFTELFSGRDLTGWRCKEGAWVIEDGAMTRKGGGDIWTEQPFGDFELELEFKLDQETNSGIFFRTADLADPVQTGIELQVLDSFGKAAADKHDCGAVYDCLEPARNVVRKPGEWNHVVLFCKGPKLIANMNGERIIDMDLDRWTEAGKNPDGTPNKFKTAYKEMKRSGYIGFQDHGKPIWYRNVRIRPR